MRLRLPIAVVAAALVLASGGRGVQAATISVGPADSYTKIEAARAGDEVVIAPGTYKFRVYLTKKGTAAQPIVIRAQDPANPPVWNLADTLVEDAPGSYTAGDRGRGCWQLSAAAYVHVSGLVITGCHNAGANSAGIRYYNGARGIVLSDIVFRDNDNGLTGGTGDSEATVEFCEFDRNGTLLASNSAPSHNIYIYGGTFTLRYSYVHDPIQAQNFHIRAHQSTIEYNWIARARSYAGDLMTDDDNAGAETQTMLLRGNVIVQGDNQANTSQIVAIYNDAGAPGITLDVKLVYNTFIGTASNGRAGLVHLSNDDGMTTMNAELDDNIIWRTTRAAIVDDTTRGHVTGTHNWLQTGADATGLTASVTGADPKLADAANGNFTLAPGSPAIGAAGSAIAGDLPDREYYRDETIARQYRARAGTADLGAFESTTAAVPIGPYGMPLPGGTGGVGGAGGSAGGAGSGGAGGRGGRGGGGATGSGGSAGVIGTVGSGGSAGVIGTVGSGGSAGAIGTAGSGGGGGSTASSDGCSCEATGRESRTWMSTGPGLLLLALLSCGRYRNRRRPPWVDSRRY